MRMRPAWLWSPVDDQPGLRAAGLGGLRVLLGALWLYNVGWKRPPDFGQEAGRGLYRYIAEAAEDSPLAAYSWVLEQVVLPNFRAFGWLVVVVEAALAAFLLAGLWTRLWALVGVGQVVAIGLAVATAPGEWPWGYYLLAGAHLVLFATAAGQYGGVDAVRAHPVGPARVAAARRGLVAGGLVALLVGVVALLVALLTDLPGPRSAEYEVTLGLYNALGAAVLLVCGALLVVAGRTGRSVAATGAAVLAALAGASVLAQLTGGDGWLGGDGTTAAAYLTVVVLAVALPALGRARPQPHRESV